MVYRLFWGISFMRFCNLPQISRMLILFLALALPEFAQGATPKAQIVPRAKAPGVDFCGGDKYYYIIRSDLGCYMRSTNFHQGNNLEIFTLHNSCRGGDHYLAQEDDIFYIIKGNDIYQVSNLSKDSGASVQTLHPNCQGGDHYLSAFGNFYIIFQKKGVYHKTTNLSTDEGGVEYSLHPTCKDGLYYWGLKDNYYFMKPDDKWGVQYYKTTNFNENLNSVTYSFHADVLNFLPGGLGITHGVSYGKWKVIKTISNYLKCPITLNKKFTRKVGYTKDKMSTVVSNWTVSTEASLEIGDLTTALLKSQFSIAVEFGGSQVNTDQEQWSQAVEVEESITITLQPKENMYFWQYQMGLGSETILFCKSMKSTSDSKPPTEIPLPPSKA